jgi:Arc/MetJ-type ribon-helix-helix transcriptional regulator
MALNVSMSVSVPPELVDKLDEMAGEDQSRSSVIRQLVREEYQRRQDDDVDRADGVTTDGGQAPREQAVALLDAEGVLYTTARSTSGERTIHSDETCRYVVRGQKKQIDAPGGIPLSPDICAACVPEGSDDPRIATDGGRVDDSPGVGTPVSDRERIDRARSSAQALVEWSARAGVNPVTILREELEERDEIDLVEGETDVYQIPTDDEEGST